MEICTPVILFMGFSALTLISVVSQGPPVIINFINLVFVLVWATIMQFLCLKGLAIVSWLLMFIISIMIVVYVVIFVIAARAAIKH